VVDGAPAVMRLAIDFHEHLIMVPAPMAEAPHRTKPLPTNVACKHRTKPVAPEASRSWQMSTRRSTSRSWAFAATANRGYIITTRRITLGDELKHRNREEGLAGDSRLIPDG
jgi:hypothetical protein